MIESQGENQEWEGGGLTSLGHVMIRGKLPFFSRWPFTMASMMLGWSEPRLTKTWETPASQRASKKAKDVVYMLGGEAVSWRALLVDSGVGRRDREEEMEEGREAEDDNNNLL